MSLPPYLDVSMTGSTSGANGFPDTPRLERVDSPLDGRHAVPLTATLAASADPGNGFRQHMQPYPNATQIPI